MKIKTKYAWISLSILLIVIIAWVLIPGENSTLDQAETAQVDYGKLSEIVFDVKIAPVKRGDLIISTNANGLVRAVREIDVHSNISGYITKLNAYEGKKVNAGDLLVLLDDREYQIALREADDMLIEAKVEYGFLMKDAPLDTTSLDEAAELENEIKALEEKYKSNSITEEEYMEIKDSLELKLIFTGAKREELILNKSGFNNARNAKERARLNIEYTKIKAPFKGIVGDFDLTVGQRINSSEPLFKLFDISSLLIDVGVLESEVPKIKVGNMVTIKLNAIEGKLYEGKVDFISPYVNPKSKTCKVTIKIINPDKWIKPGMFAEVYIQTDILTDRILVPKEALLVRDQRDLVFTVEDSLAKWKYVEVGEQNGKFAEITNGINENDSVIVAGHYTLAHDAVVNVIK